MRVSYRSTSAVRRPGQHGRYVALMESSMSTGSFSLKTRDEVIRFEQLLNEYFHAKSPFQFDYISLVVAYDRLQARDGGGRVFWALIDTYLNFILLTCDIFTVGALWNETFSPGKLVGGSVLDSQAKFFGKMDIHRFASGYIFRYRALWDKIMGLMVMFFSPENYERFAKAKSRKASFRKIAGDIPQISEEMISEMEVTLTRFDNVFRTPEAHGTGSLRRWTFLMESMDKNPQEELFLSWNKMSNAMINIGKLFNT